MLCCAALVLLRSQAIWLITTGARESAFRNIKTIAECLADELINAAKGSSNRCVVLLAVLLQGLLSSGLRCLHQGWTLPGEAAAAAGCCACGRVLQGSTRGATSG